MECAYDRVVSLGRSVMELMAKIIFYNMTCSLARLKENKN
jgi:hypothetical protein